MIALRVVRNVPLFPNPLTTEDQDRSDYTDSKSKSRVDEKIGHLPYINIATGSKIVTYTIIKLPSCISSFDLRRKENNLLYEQ
jgi:hypothetical protein